MGISTSSCLPAVGASTRCAVRPGGGSTSASQCAGSLTAADENTAIAVKVTSRGPVFYTAERIGIDGQPFAMLKFRTMVQDADKQLASLLAAFLNAVQKSDFPRDIFERRVFREAGKQGYDDFAIAHGADVPNS